jgi:hypothetical protein
MSVSLVIGTACSESEQQMADNRTGGKKNAARSSSGHRERIENPRSSPAYVRRDEEGKFKEVENVGRAAAGDQRREAEHESRQGEGDRGDRDVSRRGRESQGGSKSSSGSPDD